MKKYFIPLVALVLTTAISCKKDRDNPEPPKPSVELDDARTVLLKDLVAERLPSPFYHFEYDSKNYVTEVDYASGLAVYRIAYENRRITEMLNIRNGNSIIYDYKNNQVSEITEYMKSGERRFRFKFSYNNNSQLTEVLWYEFSKNNNGDLFKKSVLEYHPDGNLASIDHYTNSTGQFVRSKRDEFSNFDGKTNVNDFFLLQEFFDTFLFLPQVKLLKSNPLTQKIFTQDTDYDISYTYQFDNNLPVRRVGSMKQTRGTKEGETIEIIDRYSYY